MILNFTFFILACLALVVSGSFLVRHLSKIAGFLRISGFVAAFVFMAIATSLPELFVSIQAALNQNSELALGTVIGSNIADLSLIIGLAIILSRGIKVPSKTIRRDALYVFFIVVLMSVLMFLGQSLSRLDGVILLLVFAWYFYRILKSSSKFSDIPYTKAKPKEMVLSFGILFISFVVLFVSSNFVVKYGSLLALDLALPPIMIGLFLIALGSSLPEMIFQMRASLSGKGGMSLGDSLGSVVVNSTLIIGLTAIISPIKADFMVFLTSAGFMIVIAFIFLTFLESEDRLQIKEGISLIFLYIIFIIVEFYIRNFSGKHLF